MNQKFKLFGQAEVLHLNARKEGPDDDKQLAVDVKLRAVTDRTAIYFFDDHLADVPKWVDVNDRLPEVEIGGELHCFLLLKLHHQSNEGKSIVVDGYWANKPSDPAWGEDVDAPDWALETEDGDYLNLVGWAELTHHPDYSGYYTAFETTYRKIVAWMPVNYPSIPAAIASVKDINPVVKDSLSTETTAPAIVFYPAGSLGEEV